MNQSANSEKERHVIVFKQEPSQAFVLEAAAYSIGRDKTNAIVLKSASISRQHALLLRLPGGGNQQQYRYRLVDGNIEGQASKNGTFVNGQSCSSSPLKDGDQITFGSDVQAVYSVVSQSDFGSSLDVLQTVQFHSIKVSANNSKETVVADVFDPNETDNPAQPSIHQLARSPFQRFKQSVQRFMLRKVF